ncbi:hypothetical protein DSM106972_004480 [Dulcicalothrix desertica PCC 7102]|uniref:Uncharacterized protein n=1 Tax=Dulcicalothrix desertica PCC 7102 TaxID=232991 RepID=A0A3S1AV49_9CYAN|nr:hypothetical protein [Dulcicalothrix desertica]RUT09953.1 hypothetical protein DSM106972_004480 [Dulcicalothrix desertica PCC 7102]TWH41065.1 hypothetical protein CAL7102_10432 [Dulcicalothrix desertica PCC 7102]
MGKPILYKSVRILFSIFTLPVIALSSQAVLAEACNIQLHNSSSFKIREVKMSHVDKDNWGENLVDNLEDKVVWQDQSVNLQFDRDRDECLYDMKIINEHNQEEKLHGVNLCENSDFEISDE